MKMFVKSLNLIGFRNYLEADIEFHSPKTIIIGKNAQGKSNLLEVIQILSHLKSRRAAKDAELINFNLDQAIIHARAEKEGEEINIALLIRKSGRRTLKINDVPKKPKELIHNIYSVSFMVDDLEIINGSRSRRRDWMDSVISQINFDYKDILDKFEKIHTQRNSFFKDMAEEDKYTYGSLNESEREQLAVWDEMYIESANKLSRQRENFITELKPFADRYYKDISGLNIVLDIDYVGSQIDQEALDEIRSRDFGRSFSNIGPHRDDINFKLSERAAYSFASQGERRSITLAIKLAELELLKNKHGEYPILLLDDVLAELDEDRQDFLLDSISADTQVIITTTHLGSHLEKWSQNSQILEIDSGSVIARSETSLV